MKSRPETRNETSRRCWRASSRGSTKTSTRATSSRTTTWASPSRRWGCWTRRSQSCRKRCGRRMENFGARRRWACASSTRAPTSSRSRSCGARSTCRPPVIRSAWVSCTGWAARSRSRAGGSKRATCTAGCSPWTSDSGTCGSAPRRSPRRNNVSQQVVPVALRDLQRPVAGELERVADELGRIIAADFPIIAEVNEHLVRMKGKLFRPTLLLLSSQAAGATDPRAVTLAAIVELIHLATLVHDDSVDHSVLRRGMPTINALFSHQVAVIMGDYLYSRAIVELVRLDDLEPLQVFARVTNEMTVGEMRQLEAHDKLAYGEGAYDQLIRSKTASLLAGACEVGALRGAPASRRALARFGLRLGMAFQITDDLLDYTEPEAVTGKPSGLDLKEHKGTLPPIAALERMAAADRRTVADLMSMPEPGDEIVAEVMRRGGAAGRPGYGRGPAPRAGQPAGGGRGGVPPSPPRDGPP